MESGPARELRDAAPVRVHQIDLDRVLAAVDVDAVAVEGDSLPVRSPIGDQRDMVRVGSQLPDVVPVGL